MQKFGLVFMLFVCSVLCMGNTGCDPVEKSEKVQQASEIAEDAILASEPIVNEVEDAAGNTISQETSDKVLKVTDAVNRNGKLIQGLAGMVKIISNGHPIASATANVIGAIIGISGAVGAFVLNRKKKKAELNEKNANDEAAIAKDNTKILGQELRMVDQKRRESELMADDTMNALQTVLVGVDSVKTPDGEDGIGKTIVKATVAGGCADLVEAAYKNIKPQTEEKAA